MKTKILVITALLSLALILAYFFPLWNIYLQAPQYPEGLSMSIWINRITGDVNIINGLNHYIGMKKIDQNSIPELSYMPYLLGVLIIFGLVAAFLRKKWFYISWVVFFAILGILGGYDFYKWEYDYGHNLNPHAAIKIPGMAYQPPLLGEKQLLNFTAYSYPDFGGYVVLSVAFLAIAFLVYLLLTQKKDVSSYKSV